MALTRQEIEGMNFSFLPEDEDNNRALLFGANEEIALLPEPSELGGQPDATWKLLAAAPELALACLEASTVVSVLRSRFDLLEEAAEEAGMVDDLLCALDAALALAGVQP